MSKSLVIGLDEAGRGPLAGPVVAAAVILSHSCKKTPINDSKKLNHAVRLELSLEIKEKALGYSIIAIDPEEIDRINILEATKLAMRMAALELIQKLKISQPHCLVDGSIPFCKKMSVEPIIKGDGKLRCIGAASILAKVHRDKLMEQFSIKFPQYGFERHMGYPTKNHLENIQRYGPSIIHRKTFRGVKEFFS